MPRLTLIALLAVSVVETVAATELVNAGFEQEATETVPGWRWVAKPDTGIVRIVSEAHGGKQAAHVTQKGPDDWYLRGTPFDVEAGKAYVAKAWIRVKSGSVRIRLVPVGEDGEHRMRIASTGKAFTADDKWKQFESVQEIPPGCTKAYIEFCGNYGVNALIDDVEIAPWQAPANRGAKKVAGYATSRVKERLGRCVVAINAGSSVHVSWRLLEADSADTAFDVYRLDQDQQAPAKLNAAPVAEVTSFLDATAEVGKTYRYLVVKAGMSVSDSDKSPPIKVSKESQPYVSIPLKGHYTFQKVGIGDLDGDGNYDFVIKQPNSVVDPYEATGYWEKSPGTFKIEAYRHDGTFLWNLDLGWSIEQGVWYSPYIVYDLDGDGKCEVILKTGQGDPRDAEGKVRGGPEYLTILEGATGKVKFQTAYDPPRDLMKGAAAYNQYNSRNQMAVAYLDGKMPCLIVERGTYELGIVKAFQFHGDKLTELWSWRSDQWPANYQGQGSHSIRVADVDNDGRDEVLIGAALLDDDGTPVWSTGLGHPDHCYIGDLNPARPGLEVYFAQEYIMDQDGMSMVDAATGRKIWGYPHPTTHVHSTGMVADLDPRWPGAECYSRNKKRGEKGTVEAWLFDARGKVLDKVDRGFAPKAAYWDADPQRELLLEGLTVQSLPRPAGSGTVRKAPVLVAGNVVAVADVWGDWREEVITTLPGEMRIYTTPVVATDRRPCLMQDPIYRMDVVTQSMGYTQIPTLSYDMATQAAAAKAAAAKAAAAKAAAAKAAPADHAGPSKASSAPGQPEG